MKLTPGIDDFLETVAPVWRQNLKDDRNIKNLKYGAQCIMGEIYGWSSFYAVNTPDHIQPYDCMTCGYLADGIWNDAIGWNFNRPRTEQRIRRRITSMMIHIRAKHPELLKKTTGESKAPIKTYMPTKRD